MVKSLFLGYDFDQLGLVSTKSKLAEI
jgi:hypothetical protein